MKRIRKLLILCFIFVLFNVRSVYAYTTPDCIVSDVRIDEENNILGYGDSVHMSCKVASKYRVTSVVFWMRTPSKNISFEMEYDASTEKYIKNQTLDKTMLEDVYSTFMIDIWYDKDGEQCSYSVYGNTDFIEQSFVFNNLCKTGNHSYNNGEITTVASCKQTGTKTYICSICNTTKTEIIPIINHTIVQDNSVPATYTNSGLTDGSHCSSCGLIIKKQEIIPKLSKIVQSISVNKSSYTYRYNRLKKKNFYVMLGAKSSSGNKLKYSITKYPKGAKKYILVNKSGKVTLKKGIKKGIYTITITAPKTSKFLKATKTVKVKIR